MIISAEVGHKCFRSMNAQELAKTTSFGLFSTYFFYFYKIKSFGHSKVRFQGKKQKDMADDGSR